MIRQLTCTLLCAFATTPSVNADVVSAAGRYYVLRHESATSMTLREAREELVNPASGWHPDHIYAGDAGNYAELANALDFIKGEALQRLGIVPFTLG